MLLLQGPVSRIPLLSRLAITLGVVLGVFICAFSGGPDEMSGRIGLGVGIAIGLIVAVVLPIAIKRRAAKIPA